MKPLYAKKLERWCEAAPIVVKYRNSSSTTQFRSIDCDDATSTFRHPAWRNLCQTMTVNVMERRRTMPQTMTWRSWVNSQVLRT